MANRPYDIITVGGGLGGASLAKVMAERGAKVLVLEREQQFKDRVRGEVIWSWGVEELQNSKNLAAMTSSAIPVGMTFYGLIPKRRRWNSIIATEDSYMSCARFLLGCVNSVERNI